MPHDDQVLILLPAFNEEGSLEGVIRGLLQLNLPIRILVVDDGSTDTTHRVASQAGAHHVVRLPCNLGIGGAVQAGFLFAFRNSFRTVVRLDADGQHDPDDVPRLLAAAREGADLVIGSRFISGPGDKSTLMRVMGIRMLSSLCYLLTGTKVKDVTSGFRAYSGQAVSRLAREYPVDYPEPDETVMLLAEGLSVREIAVTMKKRHSGSSSIYGWRPFFYMVKVSLSMMMTRMRSPGPGVN